MSRIHQSFSIWSNAPGDAAALERIIAGAAEVGFEGVDALGGPPLEELHALVSKYGLKIATFGGHGTLTEGLNNPKYHERIEAELTENIAKAADLGVPGLVCLTGNRAGMDDYTGLLNSAAILRKMAPLAEAKGVNLNVELLNSKVDHKDYMCDRTRWGVVLCEMVGSPRIKLLYDIYHMQIDEGDVIRNIRDYGQYFGHYHTGGVPGRQDLDEAQELYYPAIMRAILETGFDLYVAHEFIPKGDPLAALKAAFGVCDV